MATYVLKSDPKTYYVSGSPEKLPLAESQYVVDPPTFPTLFDLVNRVPIVPPKYWKISGTQTDVLEMTPAEKTGVDNAEEQARIAALKAIAKAHYDDASEGLGPILRAIIKLTVDQINVLRAAANPPLPDITYTQARTVIRSTIDAG